ncbi:MAG: hypothetical protein WD646_12450 [Actinomycetota bacterium]
MARVSKKAREALLEAGIDVLLADAVSGLERLLSRDQLAKREGSPSRYTAYRAFDSAATIVEEIALWINTTGRGGFDDVLRQLRDSYREQTVGRRSLKELVDTLKYMLKLNLQHQFSSPGTPAGWVIQSAALTSSPQWQGKKPDDKQTEVGQRIIEIRKEFYDGMTERLAETLGMAMSQLGRRPKKGITKEDLVILMHSLTDGLALRLFIDPNAIDLDLAADAIYQVAWNLTEPGPDVDDRRPTDETSAGLFDRIVDESIRQWKRVPTPTLIEVADACELELDVVSIWFKNLGDLADSAVRSLIATQGINFESAIGPEHALDIIGGFLGFLIETAKANPNLFQTVQQALPVSTTAVLHELADSIGDCLARLTRTRNPEETARRLVEGALSGDANIVHALIDAVGY